MHEEDNIDFSSFEFVCDLYNEPMLNEEMSKLIIELNTGNTNWQTKDIRRSNALSSNDEGVKEAYNYTKCLGDKYELGDYIINLFVFGEKASHQRNGTYKPFSTSDYATTKPVFLEAYLKIVVNASYKKDKYGNSVERISAVRKAIRNTNFAISFNSCLRSILKAHQYNLEEAKSDIMYFVDKLLEACDGEDVFLKQFVKCATKNKEEVANKVRKYCRRKSICEALYKNIM
jgi:hypothetical protein